MQDTTEFDPKQKLNKETPPKDQKLPDEDQELSGEEQELALEQQEKQDLEKDDEEVNKFYEELTGTKKITCSNKPNKLKELQEAAKTYNESLEKEALKLAAEANQAKIFASLKRTMCVSGTIEFGLVGLWLSDNSDKLTTEIPGLGMEIWQPLAIVIGAYLAAEFGYMLYHYLKFGVNNSVSNKSIVDDSNETEEEPSQGESLS